ncbi:MAG: GtrA family protein [Lachnospiraceae bacterium]|nr:GtrA family protein [Lachnospiraceae bacterium]
MFELIKKLYYNETIRYLVVGGCTTLVNLVAFAIFCDVFGMDVTLGNVLSIIIAILFAYVANKIFVFSSKTNGFKEMFFEFCRFVGGRLSTMAIEVGGVYLIYNIMGQPKMLAKLATQVLVIIGNYFISKFLVFRGSEKLSQGSGNDT